MNVYLNDIIRYCRTAPFIQSSTKITFIFQQTKNNNTNKTKKKQKTTKNYTKKRKTRKNKTKQPPPHPPPLSKIIPKFNKKIIETVANSKHVSPNAHIYELSLSCHSTGFLILTGGVELGLRSPISFFCNDVVMQLFFTCECKVNPHI